MEDKKTFKWKRALTNTTTSVCIFSCYKVAFPNMFAYTYMTSVANMQQHRLCALIFPGKYIYINMYVHFNIYIYIHTYTYI